ncbi:MAG: S41 family peptidase [Proteobacteria bacterium]|nr:S41 family peptidase [Pseudomonadota bacterium]
MHAARVTLRSLLLLTLSACTTLLAACGGGGSGGGAGAGSGGGTDTVCGETARKQWVLNVTREWYLFPDLLPASVDIASYPTAEDLLDALTATARTQGKDRFFSYLTTKSAENSLLGEGQFVGFGFRSRTDTGNRPFIIDVFEGSPAGEAGLQRGDEVIAVDPGSGFVPVAQSLADGSTAFTDLLGTADAGVQRGLRLLRDGQTIEMQLTKRTVTIDPVPDSFGTRLLPVAGTTGVGYLHLRSYIGTADPQLRTAFQTFREQNVRDFIIDLRYNGGGLVSTAELIDNLLGGDRTSADTQYSIVYSPGKSGQNSAVRFQPQSQSVRPVRIAFLTTAASASASEININAMRAWAEVAIVGSDTYGKPVGQLAFDLANACTDRLRLITFKTVNATGASDYYEGLASNMRFACAADDTLGAPMGDPADSLTQAALQWINTGACASVIGSFVAGQAKTSPPSRSPLSRQPSAAERWVPGIQ